VRAIQDAWLNTKLTWIVGKTEHSLLTGLEGVEFVVLDKRLGLRGYAAVHRALGGRKFDPLLHMHASTRARAAAPVRALWWAPRSDHTRKRPPAGSSRRAPCSLRRRRPRASTRASSWRSADSAALASATATSRTRTESRA
jgi:hypothetical protein